MGENTAKADVVVASASRPFHELRDTGLLWLINRVVLHPRGFALALHFTEPNGGGECDGWSIVGDGNEPWQFGCDDASKAREDAMFAEVCRLLSPRTVAWPPTTCPWCGGRRWIDDENWEPEHEGERVQGRTVHSGLLPCGTCNPQGIAGPFATNPTPPEETNEPQG